MADYLKPVPERQCAAEMCATQGDTLAFGVHLGHSYERLLAWRKKLGPTMPASEVHEMEEHLAGLNGVLLAIKRIKPIHFSASAQEEAERLRRAKSGHEETDAQSAEADTGEEET